MHLNYSNIAIQEYVLNIRYQSISGLKRFLVFKINGHYYMFSTNFDTIAAIDTYFDIIKSFAVNNKIKLF